MRLFKYITIVVLVALGFSCETPMLINPDDVDRGIFVTFEPGNMNINSEDIAGTPITGTFDVRVNNVASHDVYVRRIYDQGESESDYVLVETITTFPYEFSIDGNELAVLFGVPVEEIFGNFFDFNCEATGENGEVATVDNLHPDFLGAPEQLQGFQFQGAVVCPSDPNVIVGTYSSIADGTSPDFGHEMVGLEYTITITATDEEGFYTISDFSFGDYDFFYGNAGWIPAGDWPGTIQDVCGTFFITNTLDFWSASVYGDFTFNDDGTITVVGGTSYGDTWTAVLTKQ